jgi:hypothetical protein
MHQTSGPVNHLDGEQRTDTLSSIPKRCAILDSTGEETTPLNRIVTVCKRSENDTAGVMLRPAGRGTDRAAPLFVQTTRRVRRRGAGRIPSILQGGLLPFWLSYPIEGLKKFSRRLNAMSGNRLRRQLLQLKEC